MKFGCFSLDYKRFPLEKVFRDAQRYGFDGVEIWGGRPHAYPFDMNSERIHTILNYKKQYSLEIPMYTPNALGGPYNLCSLDAQEQNDAQEYFSKATEVCAAMQCPRMLLVADHPGYAVARRESRKRFVENLQRLGSYASGLGVTLVIEALTPMESPVITTADDCAEAIEAIGLANVEAMLDVVPPNIAYEPMTSYFEKLPGKVHYVHLCNNDGRTDAHLRFETGELPVIDMLTVLKNNNFNGYVTAELYSEVFKDPEVMLANTARVLSQINPKMNLR